MVLYEQFSNLSSAIDALIPLFIFAAILWDIRMRIFKKAAQKAEEVDKKVFDRENTNSIVSKLGEHHRRMSRMEDKLNDALIDIARLGGWNHTHDHRRE